MLTQETAGDQCNTECIPNWTAQWETRGQKMGRSTWAGWTRQGPLGSAGWRNNQGSVFPFLCMETDWETSDTPAPQTPPPHNTERGKPFGIRQSELKSWLCHLSGKWPGDSHLLSLSFSTLTRKMEVKVPWLLGCSGTKGASTWETQKINQD